MKSTIIKLSDRDVELKVNAYSFILYENEFKGRNFLKDFNNVLGVDGEEPLVSNHLRFTWALAKTANPGLEDFEQFANSVSLDDVLGVVSTIVKLINESLGIGDSKNRTAVDQ